MSFRVKYGWHADGYALRKPYVRSDTTGIAINWGEPSDDTLRDQVTAEAFYRIQLAQNLAITPSVQYLADPALNPDEDEIWIGSIRTRLTLE